MTNINEVIKQFYKKGMNDSNFLTVLKESYQEILAKLLSKDMDSISKQEMVKNELFKLFDINDSEITVDNVSQIAIRSECHNRLDSGIDAYHRGVLWIITNKKGDILLSQRASDKDLFPDYWEIGGGHCGLDNYIDALEDELKDEVGLTWGTYRLKKLFKIQFEDEYEKQTAKVFQVTVEDDFVANGNDGEVQQSKYFSVEEIKKLLETQKIDLLPDNIVVLSEFLGVEQELEENIRFM